MAYLPLSHNFEGKVVVVTGAGGVLCGDMARAYAIAGAKVAALDLNEDAVKKLADELKAEGYLCEGYKANVLDREVLEEVHKHVAGSKICKHSSMNGLECLGLQHVCLISLADIALGLKLIGKLFYGVVNVQHSVPRFAVSNSRLI